MKPRGRERAASSQEAALLGGQTPASFLRNYWQKRPLLIRQAVPGFRGLWPDVSRPDAFLKLATRPDARSRLMLHHPHRRPRHRWERHAGPFGALEANMLPRRGWTLLVNSVESLVPGGWELLRRFSFLPAARIDDLMVSYAAVDGSVGPHDDAYDVFLLQGPGRRRWQVSQHYDRTADPDATIKVLRAFQPEDEWVLDPGDMLYLPPGVAHHGVAVDGPCFTYSIGFQAPSHAELHRQFFNYLGELQAANVDPDVLYQDPGLRPAAKAPLEISDAMVAQVEDVVRDVRFGAVEVGDFLGRFLTRPKTQVRFSPPARPLDETAFRRLLAGRGGRARARRLALALPSRGLVRRGRLFLNGEAHRPPRAALAALQTLLLERTSPLPLSRALCDDATLALLYGWYLAGYLRVA